MFAARRFALIGTAAAVVWYVFIVVIWSLQPLTDSVPVGVDYTLATPASVSVKVDCNTLFDSAPRDSSTLPALKAQPTDSPPLSFQRSPCAVVHEHARIVFALDTAVFLAVLAGLGWFLLRNRRSTTPLIGTEPALTGSSPG